MLNKPQKREIVSSLQIFSFVEELKTVKGFRAAAADDVYDLSCVLAHKLTPGDDFLLGQLWVLVVSTGLLSVSTDHITLCVFIPDRPLSFFKPRLVYMSLGRQPSMRQQALRIGTRSELSHDSAN